jgi:hypothetical protein
MVDLSPFLRQTVKAQNPANGACLPQAGENPYPSGERRNGFTGRLRESSCGDHLVLLYSGGGCGRIGEAVRAGH